MPMFESSGLPHVPVIRQLATFADHAERAISRGLRSAQVCCCRLNTDRHPWGIASHSSGAQPKLKCSQTTRKANRASAQGFYGGIRGICLRDHRHLVDD